LHGGHHSAEKVDNDGELGFEHVCLEGGTIEVLDVLHISYKLRAMTAIPPVWVA